jgi:two-component system chemotaxis response regulator CheB
MEKDKIASRFKVLIIGGSAGSLEVLMQVLPQLKAIANFSIVIVLHRKSGEDTTLEELLALKTVIPLQEVEDKTPLLPGYMYIAPSDYHLLFEQDYTLSLDISEKINYSRPSIDVAFESAADVHRENLVAILLSGANADGTNGLVEVQKSGGRVIIQNPETAEMPYMPQNAINNLTADYILDINQIVKFINLF